MTTTCNNCGEEMKIIDHDEQSGALTGPREKVIWGCPECQKSKIGTEHIDIIIENFDPELRLEMSDKLFKNN